MTLEARLLDKLKSGPYLLATAESCTGGLIGHRITNVSGSSAHYMGGVVAYSNAAKMQLLSVPEATLIEHGAVSAETAAAMADGARTLFDVDFALSVTGIAGPGGGTAEKPVGLTYIGLALPGETKVERFIWNGNRAANKAASVDAAFEMLLQHYDLR